MKLLLPVLGISFLLSASCKHKMDEQVVIIQKDSVNIHAIPKDTLKTVSVFYSGTTHYTFFASGLITDTTYPDIIRVDLLYHTIHQNQNDSQYFFKGTPYAGGGYDINDSNVYVTDLKVSRHEHKNQRFQLVNDSLLVNYQDYWTSHSESRNYTFSGKR